MKKYIFLTLLATVLMACNEDEFSRDNGHMAAGDEIVFGSSLPDGYDFTKTEYGDIEEVNGVRSYKVYWSENDAITVCCPEAYYPSNPSAAGYQKLANYNITPNPKAKSPVADNVTKVDKVLQWSGADKHRFYAIYPAGAMKIDQPNVLNTIVKETQISTRVEKKVVKGQGGTEHTAFVVQPDMTNALMYARQDYLRESLPQSGKVELAFKPLSTVLEITIPGVEAENTKEVHISKVMVTSGAEGKPICGRYIYNYNESENKFITTPDKTYDKTSNIITVATNKVEGLLLKTGESAVYKVFLGPDVDTTTSLTVIVGTEYGSLKKKLDKTKIKPGKVNRVTLPLIDRTKTNNNWISDMDPSVYISELSYPGSKMSLLPAYQDYDIATQFKDGIRAFIIQCEADVNNSNGLVVSDPNGDELNITLEAAINQIKKCLVDAQNEATAKNSVCQEYAVAMITYVGSEAVDSGLGSGDLGNQKTWMQRLRAFVQQYATDNPDFVYAQEIGPNTTIRDVKGKIIFKVNFNNDEMNAGIKTPRALRPMLLTHWMKAYPHNDKGYVNGIPMYWGHADATGVGAKQRKHVLDWFYQEVTNVGDADGGNTKVSLDNKVKLIRAVFEKSVDLYNKDNAHGTWYMNDIGGTYDGTKDTTVNNEYRRGNEYLITKLNSVAAKTLRTRTQNAALGLVFMNHADRVDDSGVKFGSSWLIQTVIDNNFKFPLRKDNAASPQTGQETVTVKSLSADDWDN